MRTLEQLRTLCQDVEVHNHNTIATAAEVRMLFAEIDKLLGLLELTAELQHSCNKCEKELR